MFDLAGFSNEAKSKLHRWIAAVRAKRTVSDEDLGELERIIDTLKGDDPRVSGSRMRPASSAPAASKARVDGQ